MSVKREILLKIVQSWKLKERPEYRGFRCANCQRYLHKAYYYYLLGGGYKTPLHFCKECQKKLEKGKIKIPQPTLAVNLKTFGLNFGKEFFQLGKRIIKTWKRENKPKYKIFTCDKCGKNIYKAWHLWLNFNNFLGELHFCKNCGNKLKLNNEK